MTETEHLELLRSLALRDLTRAESDRLGILCAVDARLATEVAVWKDLHGRFDEERELREEVAGPADPAEEADETFARMQNAAAAAEEELRGRLLFPRRFVVAGSPRSRRRLAVLLAAAAVLVGALWLLRGGGAPGMLDSPPDDQRLGTVPRILMNPVVSADNPSLSWAAVPGAVSYDVVVLDTEGNTVSTREPREARSTSWELSREQYLGLRQRTDLLLRVVARDGAGIAVASSGDLPLVVR